MIDPKPAFRKTAYAARKLAFQTVDPAPAISALGAEVLALRPRCVSAYAAIRTEVDPMPVMRHLHSAGVHVCLPVVVGPGQPLIFKPWTPNMRMLEGAFGARVPAEGPAVTPEVLITPLLAFDTRGYRLGYGGGFYDRTLAGLRARGRAVALGLAFEAQRVPQVPTDETDEPLDAVVTEVQIHRPQD